jgi:hypothetical protein
VLLRSWVDSAYRVPGPFAEDPGVHARVAPPAEYNRTTDLRRTDD